MRYNFAMKKIDIRFDTRVAMKLVARDLRAMRRTDKVMYYSLVGAAVFLLLDVLTIAYCVYFITTQTP